jgi:pyruvate dehydrogenase (quinone)
VLVNAPVSPMELAMPPKVTAQMARGFTLNTIKAVLNGRGDDVIELARSNLRRCEGPTRVRAAQSVP